MTVIDIHWQSLHAALDIAPSSCDIPMRSALEGGVSPSIEEYLVLCLLLKSSNPRNIFEFGTCVGGSTRVLAIGAPEAIVHSLDLFALRGDGSDSEPDLAKLAESCPGILAKDLHNVKLLKGDSRTYNLHDMPPMDFIFIDGGHDYETVLSDSAQAMRMLNQANPNATIVWHDCSNSSTPDVTRLTNELSETVEIFGAQGLTLRFYCKRHASVYNKKKIGGQI